MSKEGNKGRKVGRKEERKKCRQRKDGRKKERFERKKDGREKEKERRKEWKGNGLLRKIEGKAIVNKEPNSSL